METKCDLKFYLQMYEIIRSGTDETTAIRAVEVVKEMLDKKSGANLNCIALKEDLYALKDELKVNLSEIKTDILKEIAANKPMQQ